MKKMKHRLLSLLLAAVMICTLAPVGFAASATKTMTPGAIEEILKENWDDVTWSCTGDQSCDDCDDCPDSCGSIESSEGYKIEQSSVTCEGGGEVTITCQCACSTCSNGTCTGRYTIGTGNHTSPNGEKCSRCETTATSVTLSAPTLSVAVGKTGTLSVTKIAPTGFSTSDVVWTSSDTKVATVKGGTVTGVAAGTATITAKIGGKSATSTVTVTGSTGGVTISSVDNGTNSRNANTFTSLNQYITFKVSLGKDEVSTDDYTVKWGFDGSSSVRSYFDGSVSTSKGVSRFTVEPTDYSTKRLSCDVTVTVTDNENDKKYYDSYTIYLETDGTITLTATVDSEYYLGDLSNKGSYSVERQLENAMYNQYGARSWDYVVFDKVTSSYGELDNISAKSKIYEEDFGNIRFTPTAKGTATFPFTVYTDSYWDDAYDGVLSITVTDADGSVSGDVIFYGNIGDDVYMDSSKFEDYWDDKYPGGELEYVSFGSVSGGSLLDVDGRTTGSRSYYVSATRNQYDLDDVYFRPNSANSSKAVTISFTFTAYGENKGGSDKSSSGKVSIVYMSKDPSNIKYTAGNNGTVNLKASDFSAAYKEATGSNAPGNLTIVFQGVPSNGTLTYTDSSKRNSSEVKLTASNIRSRKFTLSSSGTNQIGDVTYTNTGSTSDTIEYIAYTGSTVKYKGKVVLTGRAVSSDITVTYQSVGGQVAAFRWADFTAKNTDLSKAETIRFSAPVNGKLYVDGSAFVATSRDLLVTQVNSITYKPQEGSNAQEKLTFMAYDENGKSVGSGTVIINVSGNPAAAPSTTPSNSNGVTSASQFTDVKPTAWYYTYLEDLVSKGIMEGRGNGVFDPDGVMTYGEALKLVLEATGHHAEALTGNDWAINYKNLAVQNGWISSDISLTAPMPRLATAALIARVLGLTPYTGESPFADTTDGYAAALYYTNPQIFVGNPNPTGGKPLFNNSTRTTLTRAEVCTIIYRLNSYSGASTSPSTPSNPGSSTVTINPNTGLPDGL